MTTEITQLIKDNFIKMDDQEKIQRILEAYNQQLVQRLEGLKDEIGHECTQATEGILCPIEAHNDAIDNAIGIITEGEK